MQKHHLFTVLLQIGNEVDAPALGDAGVPTLLYTAPAPTQPLS
jgi:hypothetical protein